MAFINFGPATVTHDSATTCKTHSGGSLCLETVEVRKLTIYYYRHHKLEM